MDEESKHSQECYNGKEESAEDDENDVPGFQTEVDGPRVLRKSVLDNRHVVQVSGT